MTPLPDTYRDHNQVFTLVRREGDVCIYKFETATRVEFEVFRVRRQKASTFPDGREYPARESVPPSEAWGTEAFTYTSARDTKAGAEARAMTRFEQMVNAAKAAAPALV